MLHHRAKHVVTVRPAASTALLEKLNSIERLQHCRLQTADISLNINIDPAVTLTSTSSFSGSISLAARWNTSLLECLVFRSTDSF